MTITLTTAAVIAAVLIIAMLGLAVMAYKAAEQARTNGYDLGYSDAKRNYSAQISNLEEQINRTSARLHQAKRERETILQDADRRIAIYARRANPFNHDDRITLQAAANQLDAAADVYSGLLAGDRVRFARQMQQRLLNLAERLAATLKASDQANTEEPCVIQRSYLVHGPEACGFANARAIADALDLTHIVDEWAPGMSFPPLDALVLTNQAGDYGQFHDRVLSYDQAMQRVAQALKKAAA